MADITKKGLRQNSCNIQGMAFGLHAQPYNVYELYFAAALSARYRIFCAMKKEDQAVTGI